MVPNPNKLVQTADKFGSYYPTITPELLKQGINSILSVCAVSDGKSLSGEFRVALGSKAPLRIPLDLELVLWCNPIPEVQFFYPVQANNLLFMNNRWHTEWYSFQDLLAAGLLACDKAKTSKESYAKLVDRCKLSLIKEEYQCAFRIEVGCPSDGDVLDLNIRWLPCSAHYLKNHSRLNSGDVATINGGSVNVYCPLFPESLRDIMHHFPVPPTLFIDSDITLDDYSTAVLDGFPAILSFIQGHVDLTIENAREYIKSPTAHSGNVKRFKPKRKNPPTSTSELAAQSHSTELPPGYSLVNPDQLSTDQFNNLVNTAELEISDQLGHQITGNSAISSVPSVISLHLQSTNPPLPTKSQESCPPPPSTQAVTDNYSFDGFYQSSNGGLSNSNGTSQLRRQGHVYHTLNSQSTEKAPVYLPSGPTYQSYACSSSNLQSQSNNSHFLNLPSNSVIQNTSNFVNNNRMNYKRSDVLMDTTMSASEFRTIFPDLAPGEGPIPECYFYLTIGELAIENCKAKSKVIKKPSTLETKLKDNAIKIHSVKSWDNNTMDNLKDKLHPLRFDRCPTISSEEMFVKAAHFYDDKELLPINTYDLSRLDLTNKISMKGFEELHKPDSTILSVKMFSPENVKKTNGGLSSLNVVRDESGNQTVLTSLYLEDIENIRNFKAAFFGLYVAKDRVVPWDKSLQPLWKFFLVHDWLKDIPNSFGYNTNEDQGSFCTSFTDSVLQTNAIRFSQKQPHMSFSELDAHFRSFCTFNQKCSFVQLVPVVNKNVDGKMKQVIKETWTPSEPGASYIAVRTICRVFNSDKNCKNSFDSKSRKCHDTNGGNKYLHICNVKMPNGRPCGQGHKNSSHPKN